MKTLILDGSHSDDPLAVRISAALHAHLPEAETVLLREQRLGNCAGDFVCWVRNPGICNVDDDNRVIAAKIAQSDLLVYLTPVTFGAYSSALKRMVDHQIQNILPFFTRIHGEIHHQKRYRRHPRFARHRLDGRPQSARRGRVPASHPSQRDQYALEDGSLRIGDW